MLLMTADFQFKRIGNFFNHMLTLPWHSHILTDLNIEFMKKYS
jgi:hypothetical protein